MFRLNINVAILVFAGLSAMLCANVNAAVYDPTLPAFLQPKAKVSKPKPKRKAAPKLSLSLILYSDSRRIAVINDKVVSEGDSLGKVSVVSIGQSKVSVKYYGKLHTLRLLHSSSNDVSNKQ